MYDIIVISQIVLCYEIPCLKITLICRLASSYWQLSEGKKKKEKKRKLSQYHKSLATAMLSSYLSADVLENGVVDNDIQQFNHCDDTCPKQQSHVTAQFTYKIEHGILNQNVTCCC